MSKKTSADAKDEVLTIVEDARETFDLEATLRGRSIRTKTVTVFTDEETADTLGGVETIEVPNEFGILRPHTRTWGLVGKVVNLSLGDGEKTNAKEIAALKKEIKVLADRLDESRLDISLRSIPPVIKKDATRAAKSALGINVKITENDPRYEDFLDEENAQILLRTVTSVTNAAGETNKGLTIKSARALRDHLPETEYRKVIVAVNELLWQRTIAEKAVEDTDF